MKTALIISLLLALVAPLVPAAAHADREADQALLKRIYQMRMRNDAERQRKENEARANVRLVTQSGSRAVQADSPTVTQLRRDTSVSLARFEQSFRCLDVDVENNGGNTTVICGSNSGDMDETNVQAGRDIVTIQGGQQ
jgi:hypothetical protein